MATLLTILAGIIFLPHITHGGLYFDDWESASLARFDTHGLFHILLPSWTNPGNRPLHNLDYSIVLAILGDHQHAFLAYTTLITVAVSIALYAALCTISIERIHAAMIAALVMVYPFADSTHLWFSATDSGSTIVLYLIGVVIAVRGLRRRGSSAVIYHALAVVLFACSIMLYEATASVIMLTGFLYWWLVGRREALPRWSADVACTVLLLLLFARNSSVPHVHGISALAQHTHTIYNQSLTLLARTVVPFNISRTAVLIVITLTFVGGLITRWRLPNEDRARLSLTRWLIFIVGGLVFAAAAMAMFIPSATYYVPLAEGIGNRVNGVPALGLVCVAYGLYMILGILTVRALRSIRQLATHQVIHRNHFNQRLAVTLGIVLAVITGARWIHLVRADVSAWDLASRYQLRTLERIDALLPHPTPYQTLFVFGGAAFTRPGVPVFAASWDLNGAVQLHYNDFTLAAAPIIDGINLTCSAHGVVSSPDQGPSSVLPYGEVILIDTATNDESRPVRRNQCIKALPAFTPGPLTTLPPPAV